MSNLPNTLTFENTNLSIIDKNGTPWLASADLAKALGYSDTRKVTILYDRHKDEFSGDMSEVLNLGTSGNLKRKARIFSPRGCHLIAMFSHTKKAKAFRRWVLDVLDGNMQPAAEPKPPQIYRHDAIKRRGVSKTRPAIGERLQDLREAHQITRRELAEMIGASDSSIWAWENARRTPNQNMIKKLSGVLGVGVKEILTGEVLPPIREVTPAAKFANHDLNGNLQRYTQKNMENHAQITKGLREAETMIYELRNKLGEIQGFSAATYSTAQEMRTCARLLTNS